MMTVYASDQFLLDVAFERINLDSENDRAGIQELLAAVESFTQGWLQPLGVGFQIVYCDPEQYFEEVGRPLVPHHFLRASNVSDDVLVWEAFSNSSVESLPTVDTSVIRHAIERSLDHAAPAGAVTTLSELQWTTVRALDPVGEPIQLEVTGDPVRTVSEVIGGQRWYCGPTAGRAGPPCWLRAVNDHFGTRFELSVFWDLWIGYGPGRALLDAGIARVLARPGWTRRA